MNKTKWNRLRYVGALATLVVIVLVAGCTVVGYGVSQAVKVDMTLTDDVIAGMYLLVAALFYLLISYMMPGRRG